MSTFREDWRNTWENLKDFGKLGETYRNTQRSLVLFEVKDEVADSVLDRFSGDLSWLST